MSDTVRFRHPGDGGGFVIVPCPVVRSAQLGPGARATSTLLRLYAQQEEHCFPGQDRLAGEVPCSRRALVGYLQELAVTGLVTVERRGLTRTNVYWIEPLTEALPERLAASPSRRGHIPVAGEESGSYG